MRILITTIVLLLGGCAALPGGQVTDAALIVHTEGSSQDMLAVTIPADATQVYESFARVIEGRPGIEVVNRKDNAMMLEVSKDGTRITAQATQLGSGQSLLYIWADAGDSGHSGRGIATSAVEAICEELGVGFETVSY